MPVFSIKLLQNEAVVTYVQGSRAPSSRRASWSPEGCVALQRSFIASVWSWEWGGKEENSLPLPGHPLWRWEKSGIFVPRAVSLFLSDECLMWNARKCHFFLWLDTQSSLHCLKACSKSSNYSLQFFWITSLFRDRTLWFLMSASECNDLYTLEMTLKISPEEAFFKDFFHRNCLFNWGKEKCSAEGCPVLETEINMFMVIPFIMK